MPLAPFFQPSRGNVDVFSIVDPPDQVIGIWPRPFRRRAVSDFTSKDDLIKACMASVHIPWFMNKHFSARHRGGRSGRRTALSQDHISATPPTTAVALGILFEKLLLLRGLHAHLLRPACVGDSVFLVVS